MGQGLHCIRRAYGLGFEELLFKMAGQRIEQCTLAGVHQTTDRYTQSSVNGLSLLQLLIQTREFS
ncbi:hypothetical protein D3C79_980830 [compost metagenome]